MTYSFIHRYLRQAKLGLGGACFVACMMMSCDKIKYNESIYFKLIGKQGNQWAADMLPIADGGFYILGTTQTDLSKPTQVLLTRVDNQGLVVWAEDVVYTQGTDSEVAVDLEYSFDNQLLLLSEVYTATQTNIRLRKIDPANPATPSVTKELGDASLTKKARRIARINGNNTVTRGYVVCGRQSTNNQWDALQLYLSVDLSPISNFPTTFNQGTFDEVAQVFQNENSLLFIGTTNSPVDATNDSNNSRNFWVYQLNASGVPQQNWKISFPSSDSRDISDDDALSAIALDATYGNGFLIGGSYHTSSQTQGLLLKLTGSLKFDPQQAGSDITFRKLMPNYNLYRRTTDNATVNFTNMVLSTSAKGSYYAAATVKSTRDATSNAVGVFRISATGNVLWYQELGGEGEAQGAAAIYEAANGDIVVLGTMNVGASAGSSSKQKIMLARLNEQGRLN